MYKERRKTAYYGVNVIVIFLTIVFFVGNYGDVGGLFEEESAGAILLLLVAAIMVHSIKAGRLYFALYGNDIGFRRYLKVYCKVTPVSLVIPFKMGEFFRMYCYGKETNNFLKGIVIVLLDRFMDTVALLVVIFSSWILFNGEQMSVLAIVFMVFLAVVMMVYFIFPGFYHFWKKYLLHAEASERKLLALRALENLQILYREIEQVIKGKGVIMFGISLVAWAVEIGFVLLIGGVFSYNDRYDMLMEYLMAAISSGSSEELSRFIFVSVLLLAVVWLIVMFLCKLEKKNNEA